MLPDKIRGYIVDDESLSIDVVTSMLTEFPEIELIGSCTNSAQALQNILQLKPDVLFLDIQMPELNGFDLLGKVLEVYTPAVIFITAFDTYAMRAFEVHALGYLLKPIERKKFKSTVDNVLKNIRKMNDEEVLTQLKKLLIAQQQSTSRVLDKIMIRHSKRIQFIPLQEIIYIEAAGDYVKVITEQQTALAHHSLNELQSLLPPTQFVRIHRSWIIQVNQVKEFIPYFNGEYYVIMSQGDRLKISRNYKTIVSNFFPGL